MCSLGPFGLLRGLGFRAGGVLGCGILMFHVPALHKLLFESLGSLF